MRKKNTPCEYCLELTEDEHEGLAWLQGVLKRIVRKPGPASRDHARAAMRAIDELFAHDEALHHRIHDLEIFTAVRDEREDQVLN